MSRTTKRWRDMTPTQRARVVVVGCIQMALLAAALREIRRRKSAEIKGGKRLWTMLAFVNGIGPIAYFTCGRRRPVAEASEPLAA